MDLYCRFRCVIISVSIHTHTLIHLIHSHEFLHGLHDLAATNEFEHVQFASRSVLRWKQSQFHFFWPCGKACALCLESVSFHLFFWWLMSFPCFAFNGRVFFLFKCFKFTFFFFCISDVSCSLFVLVRRQ